ncbi:MAG TPA: hypothetical protein VGC25_04275 [Alphaproteobacteria bacterium]|jgi:uncharacterized protein
MFGMSLSKLLVLAAIVLAVWYGFKWIQRLNRGKEQRVAHKREADAEGTELIACEGCGAYTPRTIAQCPEGRDDCPMTGG